MQVECRPYLLATSSYFIRFCDDMRHSKVAERRCQLARKSAERLSEWQSLPRRRTRKIPWRRRKIPWFCAHRQKLKAVLASDGETKTGLR